MPLCIGANRSSFLMLAIGCCLLGTTSAAFAEIRVINNSDSQITACIRYTRGQYSPDSGAGGNDSSTMSITYPDSIVTGWFSIPSGRPGTIPTPGNGDVSVYLQVAGRDIIPDTATDNGSANFLHPTHRFTTVNGKIDGRFSVSTLNEAAKYGYVRKTFYRVDPSRPISIFGTYRLPPPPVPPASPPMAAFGLSGRTFRGFATGSAEGLTFNNRFCGWYRFEPNGRLVQILPAGAGTLVLGAFTQQGEMFRVAMTDGTSATGTVFPNGFSLNLNDGGAPFRIRGAP